MKYVSIPGTELAPSALVLGASDYGTTLDRSDSFAMLDAFVERGGNMIDTALVYGNGESEKTIGAWLKARGGKRDILVATKGAHPDLADWTPRLNKEDIRNDLHASLRHLGIECINLYWLHRDDPEVPAEEIIGVLNEQAEAGKIRYFGCSNWSVARIRQANDYARLSGLQAFVGSQLLWNLARLNPGSIGDATVAAMDEASLDYYRQAGLAVFAFTSQARGFFSKADERGLDAIVNWVKQMFYNETTMERLARAKQLAGDKQVKVAAIVLAYLLNHSVPAFPIVAFSSRAQLEQALQAVDCILTAEEVRWLEQGDQTKS